MARLGDPDAFFLRTCEGALRPNARILDSTLVCRDQRGGKLGDGLLPLAAELRPQLEVVGRMPRPQLPIPRPPLEQAQHPQPGLPGVVPCLQSRALLLEEFPRTIELARPEQLGHERRRRLAGQPAVRQRPLERERLLHVLACDAAPDPEMQEPESRQRYALSAASPARAAASTDCSAWARPPLSLRRPARYEMNLGLERRVAFGLDESLAEEVERSTRADESATVRGAGRHATGRGARFPRLWAARRAVATTCIAEPIEEGERRRAPSRRRQAQPDRQRPARRRPRPRLVRERCPQPPRRRRRPGDSAGSRRAQDAVLAPLCSERPRRAARGATAAAPVWRATKPPNGAGDA